MRSLEANTTMKVISIGLLSQENRSVDAVLFRTGNQYRSHFALFWLESELGDGEKF